MLQRMTKKRRAQSVELQKVLDREEVDAAELRVAIGEILETEAGKKFFKWLFPFCGDGQLINVDAHSNEIRTHGTTYNLGRRAIYTAIRDKAPLVAIAGVELEAQLEAEKHDIEKQEAHEAEAKAQQAPVAEPKKEGD